MKRSLAILATCASTLFVGCMPKPAASPSASPRTNLATGRDALVAAGYKCKSAPDTKISLICEQDEPHIKFIFGFEEMPARMVVVLVFNYPTVCDPQRYVRMNLFNGRVDFAHASCEGKNIFYFGSYQIPERGLSAKDVTDYVHWWTTATIRAGVAAGLFEEGEPPPGGGGGEGPGGGGSKT